MFIKLRRCALSASVLGLMATAACAIGGPDESVGTPASEARRAGESSEGARGSEGLASGGGASLQAGERVLSVVRSTVLNQMAALESQGLETAINSQALYVKGAVDALTEGSPEAVAAFGRALERKICQGGVTDSELLFYSRVGLHLPVAVTERGLECTLQAHKGEDVVLWSLLDAWRVSGLPKSAALTRIEAGARDPRTIRRFADDLGRRTMDKPSAKTPPVAIRRWEVQP
jgi:hypothetical protein